MGSAIDVRDRFGGCRCLSTFVFTEMVEKGARIFFLSNSTAGCKVLGRGI